LRRSARCASHSNDQGFATGVMFRYPSSVNRV